MFENLKFTLGRRTSVRLSLQFALLYAALSAFVFIGAFWFTDFEVRDWVTDQMKGDVETFEAIYATQGADSLVDVIAIIAETTFENDRIYQLQDASGNVLAGNVVTVLSEDIGDFSSASEFALASEHDDELSGYWMRRNEIGSLTLYQGSGNHVVAEVLEAVGIALGIGYVVIVGLGLLLGTRVAKQTEARIAVISQTLSQAAQGKMAARIGIQGNANDDLSRVSVGIDAALNQIQRLLESQEQISNDIAHDLRTPLQRLRQRLEKMLTDNAPTKEDVAAALQQTEDIISTFNALLRIAQIEAQDRKSRFREVDLTALIANVVDLFEPTAEEAGQMLTFKRQEPIALDGDANLLTQLFSNLTENAIVHCPAGTRITVSACRSEQSMVVRISDNGPGISPENHKRVFERFFRAEGSRTTSGNGLGLALAKAIAELHGATISVVAEGIGTTIDIRFS